MGRELREHVSERSTELIEPRLQSWCEASRGEAERVPGAGERCVCEPLGAGVSTKAVGTAGVARVLLCQLDFRTSCLQQSLEICLLYLVHLCF